MKALLSVLKISVPSKIFIKDPETSELGKNIVKHSILLINEIGFENFTFKKLGIKIGSNESSIYRYFESKHKLLLYLSSWYWAWVEYQLVIETFSISEPVKKLDKAIEVLTREIKEDSKFSHVNEIILYKIIVNENSKSFLTKEVDIENKEGFFEIYKRLVIRLQQIINEVNPKYPFGLSLSSTIIEGALHQRYLNEHFPTITDCKESDTPCEFFNNLVKKAISENGK